MIHIVSLIFFAPPGVGVDEENQFVIFRLYVNYLSLSFLNSEVDLH